MARSMSFKSRSRQAMQCGLAATRSPMTSIGQEGSQRGPTLK
jgi:hypothetical protein